MQYKNIKSAWNRFINLCKFSSDSKNATVTLGNESTVMHGSFQEICHLYVTEGDCLCKVGRDGKICVFQPVTV